MEDPNTTPTPATNPAPANGDAAPVVADKPKRGRPAGGSNGVAAKTAFNVRIQRDINNRIAVSLGTNAIVLVQMPGDAEIYDLVNFTTFDKYEEARGLDKRSALCNAILFLGVEAI